MLKGRHIKGGEHSAKPRKKANGAGTGSGQEAKLSMQMGVLPVFVGQRLWASVSLSLKKRKYSAESAISFFSAKL